LTPQIATRAYELYERQGHRDGQSVQNWVKAEQEIRATQAKAETKPDTKSKPAAKVEPTPSAKVGPKPETKTDVKSETPPEPKPEAKTEPAAEVKAPAKPDPTAGPPSAAKSEPKPDTNEKPASEVSPQLVKKVHKFYEQLGREDVHAVEESEQAKQKTPEEETKK
jgi:hypothetical protein